MVVLPDEAASLGEEVDVIYGRTSKSYKTLLSPGGGGGGGVSLESSTATVGFVRMFNRDWERPPTGP